MLRVVRIRKSRLGKPHVGRNTYTLGLQRPLRSMKSSLNKEIDKKGDNDDASGGIQRPLQSMKSSLNKEMDKLKLRKVERNPQLRASRKLPCARYLETSRRALDYGIWTHNAAPNNY